VSNGEINNIGTINFDIYNMSSNTGSWGSVGLPNYCYPGYAGVTANYTVTKTIEIGIEDFSIVLKAESVNDVFAVLTSLV